LAGYRPGDDPGTWVDDPDPSVRAVALGALFRTGRFGPDAVARALGDPDAGVRRRGATLAGRYLSASPERADVLVPLLIEALGDPDPLVAEAVAWALGETGDPVPADAAVDALCDVAAGHDDPLVRESAVAALGAIGAARSLDVVLDALDGPPALRRRAAVALAAFDDPRADAALTRCLEDRDWQVRQVAEELLRAD
jgi:HEAT repeat protein